MWVVGTGVGDGEGAYLVGVGDEADVGKGSGQSDGEVWVMVPCAHYVDGGWVALPITRYNSLHYGRTGRKHYCEIQCCEECCIW